MSNYIEHPASGKTGAFAAKFDQHAERDGQTFTVLGAVDPKTYDATECGEMFSIRFTDGVQIEAWPEEVQSAMNMSNCIEQAREVKQPLAVPTAIDLNVLATLVACAASHVEDIESGVEEGLYRQADNTDLAEKRAAVDAAQQILDAQKPVTKQPRPLEPKASAELVERVMAMVDAYSQKPMIRRTGAGYIVAIEPKTKRALAVVDGDFGRAEFKAVYAEIAEANLASDSIIVVANTATYSGRSIHFSKFENLGLNRVEESKDERPIPGM